MTEDFATQDAGNHGSPLRAAARQTLPIAAGYVPLGIAFGLFAVSQGFKWWWATVTGLIVYSGSMEFVAVGLITAPASAITTAVTTFFVSFRHLFYGLSFPIKQLHSRPARPYAVHALTDEAYALLSRPQAQNYPQAQIIWIQALCHFYWVAGVTFGALAGATLPWDLSWLGFTLTALFVVLAIDALKDSKHPLLIGTIALTIGVAAHLLFPNYMMVAAMLTYAAVIVLAHERLQ